MVVVVVRVCCNYLIFLPCGYIKKTRPKFMSLLQTYEVRKLKYWLSYLDIYIAYVIESAAYGVVFTSCLCEKPNERVRAFDTNNE